MRTAPVKAIALPAVYRANLKCQSHMPFQHYRFAHMWTSRVLHFSAFIEKEEKQVIHALYNTRFELSVSAVQGRLSWGSSVYQFVFLT